MSALYRRPRGVSLLLGSRPSLLPEHLDRDGGIRYTPTHCMGKHLHQSGGRVDREERRERKARLVAGMLEGCKWREAADSADIRYELLQACPQLRVRL